MTIPRVRILTLALATALGLTGCLASAGLGEGLTTAAATGHEKYDATVTSFDSTTLAITVFRPGGATAEDPVPVILWSHGWGGTRVKDFNGRFNALLNAGYGIVSIDARGHGASGGFANVHNRDVEVKDFQAILDWAHVNLPWALRETDSGIPKDLVLGSNGGSYGGGFQTMTATHDGRLDALVPEITWNDLTYSLAPNGAVKSVWVHALYGAGKAQARLDPKIDAWYREAMLLNQFPDTAYAHFKNSSPNLTTAGVPTLLIQGVPDLLFNLNEAVANYKAVQTAGADVRLLTHLTGHILPGVQPIGFGGGARSGSPCAPDLDRIIVAWFNHHLKGDTAAATELPPPISFALESGECVRIEDPAWPPAGEALRFTFPAVAVPQGAGPIVLPLFTAEESTVVAGIGHVTMTVNGLPDSTLHFSLLAQTPGGIHVVDDQATAYRTRMGLGEVSKTIEFDLAGVATRLGAGDTLFLRVEPANEWYFTNGNRVPGAVALTDVTVTIPTVDA